MEGVLVRAPFERFPASVKGAFVLRSADPDPHQVKVDDARVIELASRHTLPIPVNPVTVDVAPNKDLFVPFEFPVMELGPGWYAIQVDLQVDGKPHTEEPGKRFAVAWPRASVKRGSIKAGRSLTPDGGSEVTISTIDCSGDSLKVSYASQGAVRMRLAADGSSLALIEEGFDEPAGRGIAVAYPVPRSASSLRVEVSGADRRGGWTGVEFALDP
jgi:hypothetical protein